MERLGRLVANLSIENMSSDMISYRSLKSQCIANQRLIRACFAHLINWQIMFEVSKKKNIHFPIGSFIKGKSCGGSHLGILIIYKENLLFIFHYSFIFKTLSTAMVAILVSEPHKNVNFFGYYPITIHKQLDSIIFIVYTKQLLYIYHNVLYFKNFLCWRHLGFLIRI